MKFFALVTLLTGSSALAVTAHPKSGPTVDTCAETNVEYVGNTVEVAQDVFRATECQSLCFANDECFFYTWDYKTSTCELKNAKALNGRQYTINTLSKVSGAKECIPIIPGCHLMNVKYEGFEMGSTTTETYALCQDECQEVKGCEHFSWTLTDAQDEPNCFLMAAEITGKRTDAQTISGPKHCPVVEYCYEQADYVGGDIDKIATNAVESPEACHSMCLNNPDCKQWTWVKSDKNCYLKDSINPRRTTDLTSVNKFSGPRNCTIMYNRSPEQATLFLNVAFADTADLSIKESSDEACAAACTGDCNAWTFLEANTPADNNCYHYVELFDNLQIIKVRGAVSGPAKASSTHIDEEETDNRM